MTTELQKHKYIYYRCSYGRGKCDLPYMREQDVSDRLGDVLKNIYVPEAVVSAIVHSLESGQETSEAKRREQLVAVRQRLAALQTRMDQMYDDKLDGKIDEQFWTRKMAEWRDQERILLATAESLNATPSADRVLTSKRILELANKAHSLYLTRNHAERGQLLKSILLNCTTDGISLIPTYRKPFDMIFERAKTEDWSGREDLNLRPPGPEKVAETLCCCPA